MAKGNVNKFLDKISANKELQEKFMAAQEGYEAEGKSEEEVLEDIVLPIAKDAGYEFTMSEYRDAYRDSIAENGISEEELENVSGGGGGCLFIGFQSGLVACQFSGVHADVLDGLGTSDGTVRVCILIGIGLG